MQTDQLLRERSHPIDVTLVPPKVDPQVTANGPTQVRMRFRHRIDAARPADRTFSASGQRMASSTFWRCDNLNGYQNGVKNDCSRG